MARGQLMIDPGVWQAYHGGDRGAVRHHAVYNALHVDWLGFDAAEETWQLPMRPTAVGREPAGDVLIQESVAVLGEKPHELASASGARKWTYLRELDGFEAFRYAPIPYDFSRAAWVVHTSPLARPAAAHYCFGLKAAGRWGSAQGRVLGRAGYAGQTELRYQIAGLPGVDTSRCGPRFEEKLSRMGAFRFAIACENMIAEGYVTEKLWDCLVADVVPIYFGGPLPAEVEACVVRLAEPSQAGLQAVLAMGDDEYMDRLERVRRVRTSPAVVREFGYPKFLSTVGAGSRGARPAAA